MIRITTIGITLALAVFTFLWLPSEVCKGQDGGLYDRVMTAGITENVSELPDSYLRIKLENYKTLEGDLQSISEKRFRSLEFVNCSTAFVNEFIAQQATIESLSIKSSESLDLSDLDEVQELKHLEVSFCDELKVIDFGALSQELESLTLFNCFLSQETIDLRNMHRLRKLSLSGSGFRNIIGLASMSSLKSLDIFENQFSDKIMEQIAHLNELEELKIGRNEIVSIGNVGLLKNLRYLSMVGFSQVKGSRELSKLTDLKAIDLSYASGKCIEDVLSSVLNCPSLNDVMLARTEVTKKSVSLLKSFPALHLVDLRQVNLSSKEVLQLMSGNKSIAVIFITVPDEKSSSKHIPLRIGRTAN